MNFFIGAQYASKYPAVEINDLARRMRQVVMEMIDELGDLFFRIEVSENVIGEDFFPVRIRYIAGHVVIHESWQDGINANLRRTPFTGQRFCESEQSGFGAGIGNLSQGRV